MSRTRDSHPGCIGLDDPAVSRDAIVLRRAASATWNIFDHGARNPLRVNGALRAEHRLQECDVVRIGRSVFVVDRASNLQASDEPTFEELGHTLCVGASSASQRLRLDVDAAPAIGAWTLCCAGPTELRAIVHWMAERAGGRVELVDARDADAANAIDLSDDTKIVVVEQWQALESGQRAAVTMAVDRRALTWPESLTLVAASSDAADARPPARWEAIFSVPRLRERRADIVPAIARLLSEAGFAPERVLSPDLAELLTLYDWPGETDELRMVARRASALSGRRGAVTPSALIAGLASLELERAHDQRSLSLDTVVRALIEHEGKVTLVARHFGWSRQHFYRRIERCGIDIGHARELAAQQTRDPT